MRPWRWNWQGTNTCLARTMSTKQCFVQSRDSNEKREHLAEQWHFLSSLIISANSICDNTTNEEQSKVSSPCTQLHSLLHVKCTTFVHDVSGAVPSNKHLRIRPNWRRVTVTQWESEKHRCDRQVTTRILSHFSSTLPFFALHCIACTRYTESIALLNSIGPPGDDANLQIINSLQDCTVHFNNSKRAHQPLLKTLINRQPMHFETCSLLLKSMAT